jgi:adenylate cyclase
MFEFNDYVLDVARGCLRTADREIELRPKAFEVLRCLVENSGRLVTKDELFKAVWPNVVVSDEALTQCISEVREAINDREQIMIKTMPRRGYRFAAPVSKHVDEGEARHRAVPIASFTHDAAARLSEKPSIAVLPFVNLDNTPQQDYFSDGITGDITTELSRFSDIFVIARSSAFQYKGKAIDVRQVGRELGVRYVLEGSVRRDDKRIRITAELIDATNGAHRWADRYDRELKDAFAVQDDVVRGIVSVLQVRVVEAEVERALLKPPATWEAYDYYLRGAEAWATGFAQRPMASFYEARGCLERSIAIDPGYARAYAMLARTYTYTYVEPRNEEYLSPATLERAHELARTAVQLDASLPQARTILGAVLLFERRHEEAIAEYEQALALNPNFSDHGFGLCLVFAGQPERAIEVMRASTRLEPFRNATRLAYTGNAHYMLGRYEEAVAPLQESGRRMPNLRITPLWLAAACAQLGRVDEARAAADEVRRIEPDFTIERWKPTAAYKRPEDARHLFDGILKAGLPER